MKNVFENVHCYMGLLSYEPTRENIESAARSLKAAGVTRAAVNHSRAQRHFFNGGGMKLLGTCFSICLLAIQSRGADPGSFVIEEPLGIAWKNQRITVVEPSGLQGMKTPLLEGPSGPVAFQRSGETERNISFVIGDLAPNEKQTFRWMESAGKKMPASLLRVQEEGANIRLSNGPLVINFPESKAGNDSALASISLANGMPLAEVRLPPGVKPLGVKTEVLASGPVFATVGITLASASNAHFNITITVTAGDSALEFEATGSVASEELGVDILSPRPGQAGPPIGLSRSEAGFQSKDLTILEGEPFASLNPWPGDGWFSRDPAAIRIPLGENGELQYTVKDSGAWVPPKKDFLWKNFIPWNQHVIGSMWAGWQTSRLPLFSEKDTIRMRVGGGPLHRKWALAHAADGNSLLKTFQLKAGTAHSPVPRLDEVREMVLAWEDSKTPRPLLFVSPAELAAAKDSGTLKDAESLQALTDKLNQIGELDLMRAVMDVAGRYDLIMANDSLDAEKKAWLRARTARLAYSAAAPLHWSFERGFVSGNPDMTVSRIANLGVLALSLHDHPKSAEWANSARDWLLYWLENTVDESGSWPESSHYARVSFANFVQFALCSRRAGIADFFANPKFQAMAEFYAKTMTPKDPLRRSKNTNEPARVSPPYGRGTRGDVWGLDGLLAAGWESTDPTLAATHQWSWMAGGQSTNFSHHTGMQCDLLISPDRPEKIPAWSSEFLPTLGHLWRSRVGAPDEDYLLWVTQPPRSLDGEIWPADVGAIAKWFSGGIPIGGSFVRVPDTAHPFLTNRVSLAAAWNPGEKAPKPPSGYQTKTVDESSAFLPDANYGRATFDIVSVEPGVVELPSEFPALPASQAATPPVKWTRQALLVRTATEPFGVLFLRDSVAGGQPTQWQFWMLTNGISPAGDASTSPSPGSKILPVRSLEGDHFTGSGQFGADIDSYVAAPATGDRRTLRYGTTGDAYGVLRFEEYQDALLLGLPGDGEYFVAIAPRAKSDRVSKFSKSPDGKIILQETASRTTMAYLSDQPGESSFGPNAFQGTSACVTQSAGETILILAAKGSVKSGTESLTADSSVSLTVAGDNAHLETPVDWPGGHVQISRHWSPTGPPAPKNDKFFLVAGPHKTPLIKIKP